MNENKSNKMVLFMIPICIAINIVGGNIALGLKLPIYIDAIGTIVAGSLCGIGPGVIVGVVTNIITSISLPTQLVFAIVNAAFGIVSGLLGKKGFMSTLPKAVVTAFAIWAAGFGISIPIYIFVYGGFSGDGLSVLVAFVMSTGISMETAVVICVAATELFDKFCTVLLAFLIIKSMSDRLKIKFPNGEVFIKGKENKEPSAK